MNELDTLRFDEAAALRLRSLYRCCGYSPYKMSNFEEYDLYMRNRDFLVSSPVLTFTDTDGRLMALKPDVTLSVLRSSAPGERLRKVYYYESVYRAPRAGGPFREIMQTGVELIGETGLYETAECVSLAVESLSLIGGEYLLDLSHMGLLDALLGDAGADEAGRRTALSLIAARNIHGLRELFGDCALTAAAGICGGAEEALARLGELRLGERAAGALSELRELYNIMKETGYADRVRVDMSTVCDLSYYNGIVFQGFIEGLPEAVVSGGRYDSALRKLGRGGGAIGFAVYLDRLATFAGKCADDDADVLLIYGDARPADVLLRMRSLRAEGKTVRASRDGAGLSGKETVRM